MTVVANRYRIDTPILGDDRAGLFHGTDITDGTRLLISIVPYVDGGIAHIQTDRRFDGPGVTRLLYAGEALEGRHVLVEEEPPGASSRVTPPLSPSTVRDLALALARLLAERPPGSATLWPELVYVDGPRVTGMAPRFRALWGNYVAASTHSTVWPPFPVEYLSVEEVRGNPLTRATDLELLGNLVWRWSTGAPPRVGSPDVSMIQRLHDVLYEPRLFPYDGALAEVVQACFEGATLEQVIALLERASPDDRDHHARAALLAEIVAHPDDDRPRLVYADWLLEREDPRGELIQLQCADRRDDEIERRIDELIAAHGLRWSAHLLPDARDATFARGFVATARASNRMMLARRRAALLAHGPLPTFV